MRPVIGLLMALFALLSAMSAAHAQAAAPAQADTLPLVQRPDACVPDPGVAIARIERVLEIDDSGHRRDVPKGEGTTSIQITRPGVGAIEVRPGVTLEVCDAVTIRLAGIDLGLCEDDDPECSKTGELFHSDANTSFIITGARSVWLNNGAVYGKVTRWFYIRTVRIQSEVLGTKYYLRVPPEGEGDPIVVVFEGHVRVDVDPDDNIDPVSVISGSGRDESVVDLDGDRVEAASLSADQRYAIWQGTWVRERPRSAVWLEVHGLRAVGLSGHGQPGWKYGGRLRFLPRLGRGSRGVIEVGGHGGTGGWLAARGTAGFGSEIHLTGLSGPAGWVLGGLAVGELAHGCDPLAVSTCPDSAPYTDVVIHYGGALTLRRQRYQSRSSVGGLGLRLSYLGGRFGASEVDYRQASLAFTVGGGLTRR